MIETLLQQLQRAGNPLIDGDRATFVWHGDGDPPVLIGDFTGWAASPLALDSREPGVYAVEVTLPRDAYVEYCFIRHFRESTHDTDINERAPDPYNPRVIWNGVKGINHYATMPDFVFSSLTMRGAGVARGKISEHDLFGGHTLGNTHRKVFLYHPPVDAPVPLVIVWDGTDYLERASLNIIVDNLIAQGRIRPIALALIENAGGGRFAEYAMNEATATYARRILLPCAKKHLRLLDEDAQPGCHGVLGASMGGLMALYTGLRAPDIFGQVVSQSGAFFIDPDRETMLIDDLIRLAPLAPLKIWQDTGTLEWLLDGNRTMHTLLTERGYDVRYHEFAGGHNYTMWSQTVGRALESVYGVGDAAVTP